jgi:hypothetical protein
MPVFDEAIRCGRRASPPFALCRTSMNSEAEEGGRMAGVRGLLSIVYCLLALSCLGVRAARCVVAQRSSCRAGSRGLGSHWVAHACMGVASSCVCCKPVAEGGAGVDLHMLRGARKRSAIWVRGPGGNSSALTQPRLPDARPRGGPLPLAHETRCLAWAPVADCVG